MCLIERLKQNTSHLDGQMRSHLALLKAEDFLPKGQYYRLYGNVRNIIDILEKLQSRIPSENSRRLENYILHFIRDAQLSFINEPFSLSIYMCFDRNPSMAELTAVGSSIVHKCPTF